MEPKHRFEVRYSEPVVRDAVMTFVRQKVFRDQVAMWAVWAFCVALLIWMPVTGNMSWITGLFAAIVLLPPLFALAVWRAHIASSVGRLKKMERPVARFDLGDEGLEATSDQGAMKLPWKTVKEVWETDGALMVFTGPGAFFLVPFDGAPPEALDYFRAMAGRRP